MKNRPFETAVSLATPAANRAAATRVAMQALAIATLSSLPFLQCMGFPFLLGWDDGILVGAEPYLKLNWESAGHWLSGNYFGQYVPLTFFSFMADYAIDGLNPAVFHAQNLFWHALASAGVLLCFRLFDVKPWLAFAFAAAYAVNPQKAESVAWVIERKDVLFGALAIWSFYFYAKTPRERLCSPLSLALFLFSTLAKPAAISLPAAFLCFELARSRPFDFKTCAIRLAPFFLVSATMAAALLIGTSAEGDEPYLSQRSLPFKALICVRNLAWYAWTCLAPLNCLPVYPELQATLADIAPASLVVIAALAAATALLKSGKRDFLLFKALPLAGAFAAVHALSLGAMRINGVDYADRYNYLPSAILYFAAAWTLSRALERVPEGLAKRARAALAAALCAWLALLAFLAFEHCKSFSSTLSLFSVSCIPERPNLVASVYLAVEKFSKGVPGAGAELLERLEALSPGKKAEGDELRNERALGMALASAEALKTGSCAEPKKELESLRRYMLGNFPQRFYLPRFSRLNILLDAQISSGDKDGALESLKMLIEEAGAGQSEKEKENNGSIFYYRGTMNLLQDNAEGAVSCFERAVSLIPSAEVFKRSLESAKAIPAANTSKAKTSYNCEKNRSSQ